MADLYRPYSQGLLSEEPTRLEDMYAPAATGLLFAPGAGVADLMGQAPDPSRPGEMLPSFYENITGGNYLDAGLQALGGAGDAVQMMGAAFPPLVAVGAGMKLPRGIRAYHGSPYHFLRFDMSKIGTGEGAQAYGHGLYFAENEDIAKYYRDTLRGMKDLQQDFTIKYKDNILGDPNTLKYSDDPLEEAVGRIASEMKVSSVYADKALSNLIDSDMKYIERIKAQKTDDPETQEINDLLIKSTEREIERLKQVDPADISFDRGAMYEVRIGSDPDMMLDYDAPMDKQPKAVQDAIASNEELSSVLKSKKMEEDFTPEDYTGQNFYYDLSQNLLSPQAASNELLDAGISGLKYFSDTSRNTSGGELIDVIKDADGFKAKVAVDNRAGGLGGKGRVVTTSKPYKTEQEARDWAEQATKNQERNFVIFDDSLIEIMRKYGLLAPLVGAGTVAAVSDTGEDRGLLEM